MNIETIEIGLLSKVLIEQQSTNIHIGKFIIDYNRTQLSSIPVPLLFSKFLPELNETRLEMKTMSADLNLQEDEVFKLAEFKDFGADVKNTTIRDQCQYLADHYDSSGNTGFNGKPECVEKENNLDYDLVIKKQVGNTPKPKDKGLSAGAIAGIVIACVVVVAAIIALLVYFLVIKKKNQSTTSTQGDSSIAI